MSSNNPIQVAVLHGDDQIRHILAYDLQRSNDQRVVNQFSHCNGDLPASSSILIIDLTLPESLDWLAKVRAAVSEMFIIALTNMADGTPDPDLSAYEAGADICVYRPFDLAHIEALVRRGSGQFKVAVDPSLTPLVRGSVTLERRKHAVSVRGQCIDLTPLEFKVLELLMSNPGKALNRNFLLDNVYGVDHAGCERNIDAIVCRIRKKIEVDSTDPKILLSVRGYGFQLKD